MVKQLRCPYCEALYENLAAHWFMSACGARADEDVHFHLRQGVKDE